MHPLMCLMPCLFTLFRFPVLSTISDNSKLQHAPSIKFHKLWCQARVLLLPVPLEEKVSATKLICYFPVILWNLGSGLPHHKITLTLNAANKK